jgi:hypothetical protein
LYQLKSKKMAAGDFTASASLRIQEKLFEAFQDPTPATSEFSTPVKTAEVFLQKNTARVNEVLVNGRCEGYKIMWLKSGVDSIDYSGDGSALSLTCDVADGQELESDDKTYDDNLRIVSTVRVDDDLCANDYIFTELSAQALQKGMNDIRKSLTTNLVNFVDANAGANLDGAVSGIDLGNGGWAVNADTITIEVPKGDFRNPDTLAEIDAVVQNNNIYGNYFLLNGRTNFYNSKFNADYKALNDQERSIAATYGDFEMYHDLRYLDQTLGGANTFAINPNAYVVWNRAYSQLEAIMVDTTKQIWEFYVEDPMLMIMENGVMRPVRYEVAYQKVCTGRDTNTRHTNKHNWEIKYLGGRAMAPAGVAGDTGIVKFKAVDAI